MTPSGFLFAVLLLLMLGFAAPRDQDPNGYIAYCPCMGRFGNHADQFLGALAFAKAMNRTLILPAWVQYRPMARKSVQVAFDTYFQVEPLEAFHRVITMEAFMAELAPTIWPPEKRRSFCYTARRAIMKKEDEGAEDSCNAKDGNPFGPFWDHYGVDFVGSEFYMPLHYTSSSQKEMQHWHNKFPSEEFPVLAFTGSPGAFPVQERDVWLQMYVKWAPAMAEKVAAFIRDNIPTRPFLTIHMRNGRDFKNACDSLKDSPAMFAAPQCIGYRGQHGKVTPETCYPDDATVVKQVKKEVKRIGAKTVFIATDDRDLISQFKKSMKKVTFVRQPEPADPMLDLAILGEGDHFIGNCISTFTAFVKRMRDSAGKPSSFWAFTPKGAQSGKKKAAHQEL